MESPDAQKQLFAKRLTEAAERKGFIVPADEAKVATALARFIRDMFKDPVVSYNTIIGWTGAKSLPRGDLLNKLATTLETSLDELFDVHTSRAGNIIMPHTKEIFRDKAREFIQGVANDGELLMGFSTGATFIEGLDHRLFSEIMKKNVKVDVLLGSLKDDTVKEIIARRRSFRKPTPENVAETIENTTRTMIQRAKAVDSKKFSNLTMKFSIYPPTSSVVFIRDYENKGNAAVLALLNNFQEQEELAPIVSATRDENADLLTFFYNDFKSIWNWTNGTTEIDKDAYA